MQDYKPITDNALDSHPSLTISKRIEDIRAKFSEQKKPFCSRCAKMDWESEAKAKSQEVAYQEFMKGFAEFDEAGITKNFEKYGSPERFVWAKDSSGIYVEKNNPGMKKIAVFRSYVCIERGCGITMEFDEEAMKTLKDPIYEWSIKNKPEAKKRIESVNLKVMQARFTSRKITSGQLKAFQNKTGLF